MNKTFPLFVFAASLHTLPAATTFFFHDDTSTIGTGLTFDDAEGSVMSTQGSFTLTAEAFLDGVSMGSDFNGASDGFGINAAGADSQTQRFDNTVGVESMEFSFNIGGSFDSIDLQFIEESANEGLLIFEGGNTYQLNTSTALSGQDDFDINETFTAGQKITLTLSGNASANENFSLQSFTVTAIPEPSTFSLGLIGALLALLHRRR